MAFDLAEKLAAVSKLNTGEQPQIEYLPFELVDPNPDNFYSLERLDELADSIATVGLLDPIRVRPSGERYTVTSGHRRREAIKLLIDGGDERWREALPCIVDRGEATAEFRELQLIYANSATRQLSSSELSRQAERVEALLVALKEQGYDFPGRMQEHVAQAMSVNASKLKRLHAIRSNAQEYVLDAYDEGKINEATAYELQKLPQAWQKALMIQRIRAGTLPSLSALSVSSFAETAERLTALKCEVTRGTPCSYGSQRVETALIHGTTGGKCTLGGCCLGCRHLASCEDVCPKCESARREVQARNEENQRRAEEDKMRRGAVNNREEEETARKNAEIWTRIRKAAEASCTDLRAVLRVIYAEWFDEGQIEEDLDNAIAYTRGEEDDIYGEGEDLLHESAPELAKALGCSMDYLFGLTAEPTPRATPQPAKPTEPPKQESQKNGATDAPAVMWPTVWQTGTPDKEGWYAVQATWRGDGLYREQLYWRGTWWEDEKCKYTDKETTVLRFFPLPEVVEE